MIASDCLRGMGRDCTGRVDLIKNSIGEGRIDSDGKAWSGSGDLSGAGALVSVYERQVESKTVAAR
jgi:hypothetical protein